ncbi:NADPH:quinone oxidoreductase family protein [Phreatobacter aquaticus]|uniref:NADPH:quinone oxidoreductase family protein n=1 Tax=Phreatobacter aquaticus TaxID=2570229 RepID=A0A4D7QML2_9HYPH|nr:NADPH:quinone oxidoreductase family protein [Phreatobacter aquaticus]QCK86327.1 NADPH:quinone oxidoreductase family protein [Phreatobacter aquaticus]
MKAVVVERFGPPEALVFRDWPRPEPSPGEVTVDVHAVGLNFPDVLVAAGKYQTLPPLPFVPGKEFAGIVAAVGEGVTRFKAGDRVVGQLENGAFAETVRVSAEHCYPMPAGLSMTRAAALGLTYQTSWFALFDRGRLKPGETVLVTGAGGGIGVSAMQLAKAAGCRVLAGIGSPDKRDFVLAQGADAVIDMSGANLRDNVRAQVQAATDGHGADVVIENVGGPGFEACLRALAWDGRLVVVGFAGGEIPSARANYILVKHIAVTGIHWSDYLERMPDRVREVQADLFAMAADGRIDPPLCAVVPIEEIADAMELIVTRKALGKVVLVTARGREPSS